MIEYRLSDFDFRDPCRGQAENRRTEIRNAPYAELGSSESIGSWKGRKSESQKVRQSCQSDDVI